MEGGEMTFLGWVNRQFGGMPVARKEKRIIIDCGCSPRWWSLARMREGDADAEGLGSPVDGRNGYGE
jgi:hypothetical protein